MRLLYKLILKVIRPHFFLRFVDVIYLVAIRVVIIENLHFRQVRLSMVALYAHVLSLYRGKGVLGCLVLLHDGVELVVGSVIVPSLNVFGCYIDVYWLNYVLVVVPNGGDLVLA